MPLPHAPDPVSTLLLDGRLPALLTGIVLVGWGAKVYRLLVLAPGILAGVYLGAVVKELAHLDGMTAIVTTIVLAAAGALLCHFVEGIAIRVGGAALFGATAWFAWPMFRPGATPIYVTVGALIVGAFAFPSVYRVLLRPITALVGAWSIAWAMERPHDVWLVGGLALAGTALQFALDRGGGGGGAASAPKPKREKPKKSKSA